MFSPIVQNKGCLTAPGKASQGKGISASAHRSFQVYIYLSASAPTGFALNARNRALGFLGVATAGRRAILRGMQRWFFCKDVSSSGQSPPSLREAVGQGSGAENNRAGRRSCEFFTSHIS